MDLNGTMWLKLGLFTSPQGLGGSAYNSYFDRTPSQSQPGVAAYCNRIGCKLLTFSSLQRSQVRLCVTGSNCMIFRDDRVKNEEKWRQSSGIATSDSTYRRQAGVAGKALTPGNSKLFWARAEHGLDFDIVKEPRRPSLRFLPRASSSSRQLGTLWLRRSRGKPVTDANLTCNKR